MRAEPNIVPPGKSPAGWVIVHSRYRRFFARAGLNSAHDFDTLPGEVVSGHPDRHVVRVVMRQGKRRLVVFLKREHRVPWRDRFASLWAGIGWASKSEREARLLQQLEGEGIPAPQWMAYGEDGHGRAFLLVRSAPGAVELRSFLQRPRSISSCARRELAKSLGHLLGRIHAAGFDCPDLWSKHVLVHPRQLRVTLIDWQRSRRASFVTASARIRDLAALHASLANDLVNPRERLIFLRTYLSDLPDQPSSRERKRIMSLVRKRANQLLDRRFVREMLRPPLANTAQRLRWLDGEALCVTRRFWKACRGKAPDWLRSAAGESAVHPSATEPIYGGERFLLRQFPAARLLTRLVSQLRGRRIAGDGLRQAMRVFRLQRFKVPRPRLLAFGQRPDGGSFVLLQQPIETMPLEEWLSTPHHERRKLLRATGALIRRVHDASYRLLDPGILHVQCRNSGLLPILVDVAALGECRRRSSGSRDLAIIKNALALNTMEFAAFTEGYEQNGESRIPHPQSRTSDILGAFGGLKRHV